MIGVVHTYSLLERHSSFNVIRWSQYPKIKKMAVYCLVMTKIQCMCNVQFTGEFACARSLYQLYYFVFFFGRKIEIIWNLFVLFPFWLCLNFFFISFLEFRFVHLVVWSVRFQIELHQCKLFHFIVDCRIFFFKTETETEKAQAPVWNDIYRYIYLYVCKSKCKINWQTFWTRAVTRSTLDMLW